MYRLHCVVSNRTKVFVGGGVFVLNGCSKCERERYVRAPDLAAHKRSSLDCALQKTNKQKKRKAHIIRTVMYVWISPWPLFPHLYSNFNTGRHCLTSHSLSNYSCLPLTVNFSVESILFHTFHPVSSLVPAPRKGTGSAVEEGRSQISVTMTFVDTLYEVLLHIQRPFLKIVYVFCLF